MGKPDLFAKVIPSMAGIGSRLREERKRLSMSQTDFAKMGGIVQSTQASYEAGGHYPRASYLDAISKKGVDTGFVLTGKRDGEVTAYAPEEIVNAVLAVGTKRSGEYRRGMVDVLAFRMYGEHIQCPYREGTAQFDAYFAGNDRGHAVWRAMLADAGQR